MKVQEIKLKNYKIYEDLQIDFLARSSKEPALMNIFIGDNGAGKSAILEAIAKSINWLPARIQSTNKNPKYLISSDEIKNGSGSAAIKIKVSDFRADFEILDEFEDEDEPFYGYGMQGELEIPIGDNYKSLPSRVKKKNIERLNLSWETARTKAGSNKEYVSNYKDLNEISKDIRELINLSAQYSLPAVMYYGAERGFINPNRKILSNNFTPLREYADSLNGKSNFRQFFAWFEELENIENQKFREFYESKKENVDKEFPADPRLQAVREAIFLFLNDFSEIRINRESQSRFTVVKLGETFNFDQLSQGEKNLLSLVGDIARTLCVMNPFEANPLDSKGIILIDEIDLHLHPKWQADVIRKLQQTFRNCQFFVTTHSPLVLSSAKNANIFKVEGGKCKVVSNTRGESVSYLLEAVMESPIRDREVSELVDSIYFSLEKNKFNDARFHLQQVEDLMSKDSTFIANLLSRISLEELLVNNAKKNY